MRTRKAVYAVLAAIFTLGVSLGIYAGTRDFVTQTGDALPRIEGTTATGSSWSSSEKSAATLVHVFSCESDTCAESLAALEEFVWRPLRDKGARVVGIARDADVDASKEFVAENDLTFPILPDPERAMAGLFASGGAGVPRTLVADASGKIVYQHAGFTSGREAEFRRVVEAVIEGDRLPKVGGAGSGGAVDRNLMARDFRRKPAPEMFVEQWITRDPGDTNGKYVLYEFWATWCGPCRTVMPHLEEISKTHSDRLAIMSVSDEPAAVVEKFVERMGFTYPIGIDTKRRTIDTIGVQGIPHGMLVNPEGTVVWQGHPGEFMGNAGEKKLENLLSGE